jgi:hypothetical protein
MNVKAMLPEASELTITDPDLASPGHHTIEAKAQASWNALIFTCIGAGAAYGISNAGGDCCLPY